MERRRAILLVVTVVLISWFGSFLNKVSFDPNYSAIDVFSSASKKAKKSKTTSQADESWNYTWDDVQLSEEDGYREETIKIDNQYYTVICNENRAAKRNDNNNEEMILLSNTADSSYQKAVAQLADYYAGQGYDVKVEKTGEMMMTSYAHAGRFDVFLLREEDAQ